MGLSIRRLWGLLSGGLGAEVVSLLPDGRLLEGRTVRLSSPRSHTPSSLQFPQPKKESACEKRGLSGPGVTTASPAPLPAWVRRTLAVTPPLPAATSPSFPDSQAGEVGEEGRGPLGSPGFPVVVATAACTAPTGWPWWSRCPG